MDAERRLTTYTLTVARESGVSFDRKTREAILPCFPGGTPAMNDDRKFRCDPADADKVLAKFQNAKTPRPLNFAHGKDPVKGQKAAGKLVECIRTAEDGIDFKAKLTPAAAKELEDGEWFATSAKFSAWTDSEGFLHPEEVIHLSLTNEPAIDGMHEICLLEADHEAEVWEAPVPIGVAMEPDEVVAAIRKLLGLPVAATEQEINEQIRRLFPASPSPEMASVVKEPEMEKAQAPPQAPGAAGAGGDLPKQTTTLDRDEVKTFVQEAIAEAIAEDRKAWREEFIREERQKTAVENAIASGKVTVGCREAAEKLAASNIEAFEAFVASAPTVAPVKRAILDSPETPLDQIDFSTANLDDDQTRKRLHEAALAQIESKKASSYEEAIQLLTRKAVN